MAGDDAYLVVAQFFMEFAGHFVAGVGVGAQVGAGVLGGVGLVERGELSAEAVGRSPAAALVMVNLMAYPIFSST